LLVDHEQLIMESDVAVPGDRSTGGVVVKASTGARLAKGARITGADRQSLGAQLAERYQAGDSIRTLAQETGRSFGFVHGVIKESGVSLRGRGGATRRTAPATTAPAEAAVAEGHPATGEGAAAAKGGKSRKADGKKAVKKSSEKKDEAKKAEGKKEKGAGKKKGRS
jgi:hypothetical protein